MSARALRALAVLAWALALAGATLGFFVGRGVYEAGIAYGDPGPALPDLDGPPRAINTQLELEPDAAARRRALRMIREAGFGWIRQQFAWSAVEIAGKGQFVDGGTGRPTWEMYDEMVQLAQEEGLRIIARLDLPPEWARPPGSEKTHPPANVHDYGDFVAALVERYRGRIGHVQIWNEPNLRYEWGGRPVDPAGYVELLKAGYRGAKRADQSVRVLSGELAQTLEPDAPDAEGLDDLLYLDRMYAHGAKPYFDVLAANAYGLHTGPEDRQVGPAYTNFPRVLLTREVMLRHGDGGKAVWVTEFGWNALPPDWTGRPSPWGQVSAGEQARYIVRAYQRAQQEWPWMGPMALWLFRQARADREDPTPYFGLVDGEWRPRPAYRALQETAGRQPLGIGVHQESSTGLAFEGTWQWTPDGDASLGGIRESPISGARLTFRFQGTKLDLLAPVGPSRGLAHVKINGVSMLANRLPRNAQGQATIDQYAPAAAQRRIPIADGLPDRAHEVELTVVGGQSPASTGPGVGIDAVIVSRARPLLPALTLGAAWAGTLPALLWLRRGRVLHAFDASGIRRAPVRPLPSPFCILHLAFCILARLPARRLVALGIAASLPFTPLAIPTPVGRFAPVELLALLLVAVTAARLYLDGELRGWKGAFAGPAALWLLAGFISLAVADYPRLGLREVRTLVLEPALFYFLARAALRGPRDGLALALAFLGGAALAAGLALGQTALGRGLVAAEGVARAAALYPSPNNLALLLDRALPLAVALALYGCAPLIPRPLLPPGAKGGSGSPSSPGPFSHQGRRGVPAPRAVRTSFPSPFMGEELGVRVGATLAALVCGGALFFTFSRGAWLATAVAVALVLAPGLAALPRRIGRRSGRLAALGAALAVLAGVVVALRFERFASLLAHEGTGVLRLHLWRAALQMAWDHPWWGVGMDQFLYHYPRYMRPEAWREPSLSHPHNIVLDFWLRLGLLGLAGLGWAAWLATDRARQAMRAAPVGVAGAPGGAATDAPSTAGPPAGIAPRRGIPFALGLGGAGALVALVIHGLVDNSYFVADLAYATWIVLLVVELAGETGNAAEAGEREA